MNRTYDLGLINQFSKMDPDKPAIGSASSVYFMHEPGVAIFPAVPKPYGFSVHAWVKPDQRGKRAVQAAKECVKWLFRYTEASRVTVRVRHSNKSGKIFTSLVMDRSHSDETWTHYQAKRLQYG